MIPDDLRRRRIQLTNREGRHWHEVHGCEAPDYAGPGCECLIRAQTRATEIMAELHAMLDRLT